MRKRLTPGVVLGTVALIVAMTGSAVGASLITGKQVKNSSLTGKDIKNKSLTKKDFKGSVRGPRGLTGPQGTPGATGLQGPAGPSNVTQLTEVFGTLDVAAGTVNGGDLSCPDGMTVVSGGFSFQTTDGKGAVVESVADETLTGWSVFADNTNSTAKGTLLADAFCAPPGAAVSAPAPVAPSSLKARHAVKLRHTAEVRRKLARLR
jgi:hypothetical protein